MTPYLEIDGRTIGPEQPCYIIAEAGVNHDGDEQAALQLVDAARAAGANAVKFQTFKASALAMPDAPKAAYQRKTTDPAESQLDMLRRLEMSRSTHEKIAARCRTQGITFLSTPFDEDSADMLDQLGVPAFKIGSGDLTNLPLIRHLALKRKPIILSTGMATEADVEEAVQTCSDAGLPSLALLHCVSCYPADAAAVNLRAMQTLRERFHLPVGFSDHTRGIEIAIAAAALGAHILEKHLTLSRAQAGPDHAVSLEPLEFKAMVFAMRNVEKALGSGLKTPSKDEADVARVARRSLFAACPIPAGTPLESSMVMQRRPGTGLAPGRLRQLIGQCVVRDIAAGEMLADDMFKKTAK